MEKSNFQEIILSIANEIRDQDIINCKAIGENGSRLIENIYKKTQKKVNILTHCNAGWLAAVDWGTALAPIFIANQKKIPIHVWVDETRPRNQGANLTSYELNEEGGIDPLEFRFYAAVDRVATTGTVWMGLTTGCAQCHTHKYDPITHDEYFGLMSLLDNVEEPDLFLYTDEQVKVRADLEKQIAQKITELQKNNAEFEDAFVKWHKTESEKATPWKTLRPTAMMKLNQPPC